MPALQFVGILLQSSTTRREENIGNFQGKISRHHIVAVAEDDDGGFLLYEMLDGGAETHGLAVVPHAGMIAIWIQKPAEAVRRRLAVRFLYAAIRHFDRSDRRLHLGLTQQSMVRERLVPLGQIVERGIDA